MRRRTPCEKIQREAYDGVNEPHCLPPNDAIHEVHDEEGDAPTDWHRFGDDTIQRQTRQQAQRDAMQVADEGRVAKAIRTAGDGREDRAIISSQEDSEEDEE